MNTGTKKGFRARQEDFPSAEGPSVGRGNKNLRQGKALNLGNLAQVKRPVQSSEGREVSFSVLPEIVCAAFFLVLPCLSRVENFGATEVTGYPEKGDGGPGDCSLGD